MERDLPGFSPGDPERRLYVGGGADREPTRAELLESNVHLRLLLSSVAQAVWEADPDGTITADSPSWRAYTGQSLDNWRADGWTQAIHPDDRDMALSHWQEAVRTRSPVDAEFRIWNAGRGWRWTNARAAPVFNTDGTLMRWVGLNIDIDERKRAEEELRSSRSREVFLLQFSDAIRSCNDTDDLQRTACRLIGEHLCVDRVDYGEVLEDEGVAVLGPDYHVEGCPSLTGRYPLDRFGAMPRLQGGQIVVVDDVETAQHLSAEARQVCSALGVASFIASPLVRDGTLVWTLTVQSRVPRAWTAQEVSLVREAGERTWADVERARAQSALAETNRRKDEFIATLAHELRNPLAPIRNGLQIARLSSLGDPVLLDVVEMMDRQLAHLARLVDDLLDIARIGAGKIVLTRAPVDLVEVIARSIENVRSLIEQHGHALEVRLPPGRVVIDGDPERLTQVFTNLLQNAAKYTEHGGRVSVHMEVDRGEAEVRVMDTGIGIPPEHLQQVFDLFSQVRLHQRRAEGGLGVGLALVRKLVEMHGGAVKAHSAGLGHGCTLVVRLPLPQVEPMPDAAPLQPEPAAAAQGCRVLVADDNVDAAESLGVLLRLAGHEVTVVHDGAAAVAAARAQHPEVAVLDLGMPGLDGLEAARRIRALPGCRSTRLIALTGWGQESDRARTRAAGFDHHLVKPADPADVTALLRLRDADV